MIFRVKYSWVSFLLVGTLLSALLVGLVNHPSVMAENNVDTSFAVLMYHHISKDAKDIGDYVVTPTQLEADFQYLKQRGYRTLTLRDLYAIESGEKNLPKKSVMITFDDGQESFYVYAYPLLEKYGFSAIFSIIGEYTDLFSSTPDHTIAYSHVTWEQMRDMTQSGRVEFGNHSYALHHHNEVGRVGVTKAKGESNAAYEVVLRQDIQKFEERFRHEMGFTPTLFTYPFGRYDRQAERMVREGGYAAAFTCYEKRVVPKAEKDWLYHLGRFNRSGKISTDAYFRKCGIF